MYSTLRDNVKESALTGLIITANGVHMWPDRSAIVLTSMGTVLVGGMWYTSGALEILERFVTEDIPTEREKLKIMAAHILVIERYNLQEEVVEEYRDKPLDKMKAEIEQ